MVVCEVEPDEGRKQPGTNDPSSGSFSELSHSSRSDSRTAETNVEPGICRSSFGRAFIEGVCLGRSNRIAPHPWSVPVAKNYRCFVFPCGGTSGCPCYSEPCSTPYVGLGIHPVRSRPGCYCGLQKCLPTIAWRREVSLAISHDQFCDMDDCTRIWDDGRACGAVAREC